VRNRLFPGVAHRSQSHLPEDVRTRIADTLNARLAEGLDLSSQIKVAHWNIKGS
jgi:starvation-inducible DNA-binding protein